MQINFTRLFKETFALSLGIFLVMLLLGFYGAAFALALGSFWGCANFYVIKKLIISCFTNTWDLSSIAAAILVKFPVLYGAGFLILRADFPPIPLLFGMSLIFITLLLKITTRSYERVRQ